jgi:hypothetical protein
VAFCGSTNDTLIRRLTLKWCHLAGSLSLTVVLDGFTRPSRVARFLGQYPRVKVVMVAGNREGKAPWIGARVEWFLCDVFVRLGHARTEGPPDG